MLKGTDGVSKPAGFFCVAGSVMGAATNFNRYKEFVSKDGARKTFVSDTDILDEPNSGSSNVTAGTVYKKDGTRYRIEGGKLQWISDRNGNLITFLYDVAGQTDVYGRPLAVDDALGRRISISYGTGSTHENEDYIDYPGFSGSRRVTIRYQLMSTRTGGAAVKTVKGLFLASAVADQPNVNNYDFNPSLPAELELPDGRKFLFSYNIYGELSGVELPTGGVITYDWSGHTSSGDGLYGETLIYRRMDCRKVYAADGTTLLSQTDYASAKLGQDVEPFHVTETEKNGLGVTLRIKEHIFHGKPPPRRSSLCSNTPAGGKDVSTRRR